MLAWDNEVSSESFLAFHRILADEPGAFGIKATLADVLQDQSPKGGKSF